MKARLQHLSFHQRSLLSTTATGYKKCHSGEMRCTVDEMLHALFVDKYNIILIMDGAMLCQAIVVLIWYMSKQELC
jgi:hypothetical protein